MQALAMAALMVLSDDSEGSPSPGFIDGTSSWDLKLDAPTWDSRGHNKRAVHPTPHVGDGVSSDCFSKKSKLNNQNDILGFKILKNDENSWSLAMENKTFGSGKGPNMKTNGTTSKSDKKHKTSKKKKKKKMKTTHICSDSDSETNKNTGTIRRKPYPTSQLCRYPHGCRKIILSKGLCFAHGGGRRCSFDDCDKGVQGGTDKCIGHGGGRRCTRPGCDKVARGRNLECSIHMNIKNSSDRKQMHVLQYGAIPSSVLFSSSNGVGHHLGNHMRVSSDTTVTGGVCAATHTASAAADASSMVNTANVTTFGRNYTTHAHSVYGFDFGAGGGSGDVDPRGAMDIVNSAADAGAVEVHTRVYAGDKKSSKRIKQAMYCEMAADAVPFLSNSENANSSPRKTNSQLRNNASTSLVTDSSQTKTKKKKSVWTSKANEAALAAASAWK